MVLDIRQIIFGWDDFHADLPVIVRFRDDILVNQVIGNSIS
jgi:hypothetical protein